MYGGILSTITKDSSNDALAIDGSIYVKDGTIIVGCPSTLHYDRRLTSGRFYIPTNKKLVKTSDDTSTDRYQVVDK